jgi:tRNA(Ile)-lysidine synthase TilS/MesJ
MPKLTAQINDRCYVACSGGADSLAALMFCHNHKKRDVTCLFVNHGTEFSRQSQDFLSDLCTYYAIEFVVHSILPDELSLFKGDSKEHLWGKYRNNLYKKLDRQVIVGHTLEDANERWIMKSLSGSNSNALYPFVEGNITRPFLLWTKEDCRSYLKKLYIDWLEDPTNYDSTNLRSWMRMSGFSDSCNTHFGTIGIVYRKILERMK